jgi:transposase
MPVYPLNREKTWLMPPTLDELIPPDHPARFVAAFVDGLEGSVWKEMEINLDGDPLGAPSYHPRAMLCVWLYGFMTGTRSSRKLETACRDQMSYLWLTGWQRPDHNSLWRFYKAHRHHMRKLFKRTVRTALNMGLVDMAVQAVDGTKVAANAAKKRTYTMVQLQALEGKIETAIEELEAENETGADPMPVHLPEKLADKERLLSQVKAAMADLAEEEKKRVNFTDGDAAYLKTRQENRIAGYNLEAVVSSVKVAEDVTSRLITAIDVTAEQNDVGALIPMMEQAEETTLKKADVTLADANFHSGANLEACAGRKQTIVMSEPRVEDLAKPYHKDRFIYNASTDSYICPKGKTLKFLRLGKYRDTPVRVYSVGGAVCRQCPAFGECTKDRRNGRRVGIGPQDFFLRRHREWMATREAKDLYRKRKELPEPVFGIMKEQMAGRRFLLRGLTNVRAEATLLATAFNLRTLCKLWKKRVSCTGQLGCTGMLAITNGVTNRPDIPLALLLAA